MWVGLFDRHRHRRPKRGRPPANWRPGQSSQFLRPPSRRGSLTGAGSRSAPAERRPVEREAGRRSGSSSPERPTGARVSPGPGLRSAPVRTDSSRAPGRLRDRRAIHALRRPRTPFSRAPSPRVTAPRFPSGRRAAPGESPPGEGRRPAPKRGRHRRRPGSHREPPTLPPPRTPRRSAGRHFAPAPREVPAAGAAVTAGRLDAALDRAATTDRAPPAEAGNTGEPGPPPALRRKAPPGTEPAQPDGRHPRTHLAPGHRRTVRARAAAFRTVSPGAGAPVRGLRLRATPRTDGGSASPARSQ